MPPCPASGRMLQQVKTAAAGARLPSKNELAKAIDYSLKRWAALTRFLHDGRLCMSTNAAERALRGIAIGRNYAKPMIMRSSP
jgi:Transposase IS66 family